MAIFINGKKVSDDGGDHSFYNNVIDNSSFSSVVVNGVSITGDNIQVGSSGVVKFEGEGFVLLEHEAVKVDGVTLYPIKATRERRDGKVQKGERGGLLRSATCLSGEAWVEEGSKVTSITATVKGHALVSGDSVISGQSTVKGNADVFNTNVSGQATVKDDAVLMDSFVSGQATVKGNAKVLKNSKVSGQSTVTGDATVMDSDVSGQSTVKGNAMVSEAQVSGMVTVRGEAVVHKSRRTGMGTYD